MENSVVNVQKVNLLGLSQPKMEAFFAQLGEKKFRAQQVLKWIHHLGAESFDEMSNISKALRTKLNEVAEIRPPEVVQRWDSKDGTRKWLIGVSGGQNVEMVYIPEGGRGTLCVSSQVGCALDCSFCSTGKQGFNRDLTASEIIGQVFIAAKSFDQFLPDGPRAVTNVVMMGMGEPLLNFENVMDSMSIMMNDYGYGISKRRVTLSTSGVVPMLDKMSGRTEACLALSLHAPNNELRNELVPINKKYPIEMLLASAKRYIDGLPDKRTLTIEYTLIREVNDRLEHAQQLAALLQGLPCKINLIPFNPFPNSGYEKVSNNALYRFRDTLHEAGYVVTIRTTRGDDIDAACGQLAGQFYDRTRRRERYEAKAKQIDSIPVKNIN